VSTPYPPDPPARPPFDRADYYARVDEARRRLATLLDPKTGQERQLVTWLGEHLDLPRLLVLVELVEYRLAT
jgi:hypothetical protein